MKTMKTNLLLDTLARWLRLAGEKGVYVEYRFTGAAPGLYRGEPRILAAVDSTVRAMVDACARLPERERWMELELSRDGDGIFLSCAASGDCSLPPGGVIQPGLQVTFRREEENVRLEVRTEKQKQQTRERG